MSATARDGSCYSGIFIALLIALIATSLVVRWRLNPVPPIVGDKASPLEFSSGRAATVLSYLLGDESPHPVDSTANTAVRQKILETLSTLGYRAEVQDTTSCVSSKQTCARIRNILAIREGDAGGKVILLTAHYDSVPAGPGASDDGAGVAILLEIARLIKHKPPGRNAVAFLFTEGEEAGLLGAQAFASRHPLAGRVASVINIEARGTSGQSMLFETGSTSGWLVGTFASTSRRPLANSLVSALYTLLPNDTDLSAFKSRGLQGLNFAYGEHVELYHTPLDNLRNLDRGSLQQQGDNVYDLVGKLMASDIPEGGDMGSFVYTDLLGFAILHWPTLWGVGAAIGVALVFALATWRLRVYRKYSPRSIVFGTLGFIISAALGAGVAYALAYVLVLLHGQANAWHTSDAFNRLFLWSGVLLAVISMQRLVARINDPIGLWLGLGWAWLSMALATALLLPGASYLFLLPSALFAICSLGVLASARRSGELPSNLFMAAPTLIAFPIVIPAIFLVEIMIGFNDVLGVAVMGGFMGFVASLFLPFTASRQSPRVYKYATCVLLATFVIGGALSLHAPAYTAERPQPLNVMYVQHGDGKAMVAAGNASNRPPDRVLHAMGEDAALRVIFPWSGELAYSVPVATAGLHSPLLAVLEKTRISDTWRIVARIETSGQAGRIQLLFPKAAGLRSIEMDGARVDYAPSSRDYAHFVCVGESCNGRQVTLTLNDPGHDVIMVAGSRRLPDTAMAIARARIPLATPRNDGDQSLAITTIRL